MRIFNLAAAGFCATYGAWAFMDGSLIAAGIDFALAAANYGIWRQAVAS